MSAAATSQRALLPDHERAAGVARIRSDIARAAARGETHFLSADLRIHVTWARADGRRARIPAGTPAARPARRAP